MPRRSRRKGRGGKRGGQSAFNEPSRREAVTRVQVKVTPFIAQYVSGQTGALTTAGSGLSRSGASTVPMNPVGFGLRVQQLCQEFQLWRVRKLRIAYRTSLGSDGALPSGAVQTTLNYVNNRLAFGFTSDPAFAPVSFLNAVEYGATVTSCRSNAVHVALLDRSQMNGWRYTQSDSTASTNQSRFADAGVLYAFWALPAAANVTNSIGEFDCLVDLELKYPADNTLSSPSLDAIPQAMPMPSGPYPTIEDEKKETEQESMIDSEAWQVAQALALSLGKTGAPVIQQRPSSSIAPKHVAKGGRT
jgi:hypothetical protein